MAYAGQERRAGLTEEQIDHIAEQAAEKALQKVYAEVGRSIVNKLLWFIGAAAVAVLMWMGSKGIKP